VKVGSEVTLVPIAGSATIAVGDEVEVQLSLRAKAAAEYVHLRDPRPAGLEPDRPESGWKWDLGVSRYEETRDSGANFFFENLPAGEYTARLRANSPAVPQRPCPGAVDLRPGVRRLLSGNGDRTKAD
jgi:hypothetical protein